MLPVVWEVWLLVLSAGSGDGVGVAGTAAGEAERDALRKPSVGMVADGSCAYLYEEELPVLWPPILMRGEGWREEACGWADCVVVTCSAGVRCSSSDMEREGELRPNRCD